MGVKRCYDGSLKRTEDVRVGRIIEAMASLNNYASCRYPEKNAYSQTDSRFFRLTFSAV
jgi:hypothetical protein